jgi:uncharacterized protein
MTRKNRKFVLDPSNGFWGLAAEGKEADLARDLASRPKPKKCYDNVQVIALNTTEACNLSCVYCSTSNHRSSKIMPLEVTKRTIDQTRDLKGATQIVFHGSEPLLSMKTIQEAVLYGERFQKETGKKILFSVQSNLTTLTEEKIEFICAHEIGISTSLDGREQEHNLNRPYKNGRATYNDARRAIDRTLEFQKGLCAVCVVTRNNVSHLSEIALDFERIGITEVQFLPAIKCDENTDFIPSVKDLTKNYIMLLDQTFRRIQNGNQRLRINIVSQYLSGLFFRTGVDACRLCTPSNQHPLLAVDLDGEIYPCDFFWGDKKRSMGNITNDSFGSVLNSPRNLRMDSIETTVCGDCEWIHVCGGGCLGDRLLSEGRPYYCEVHRAVFEYLSQNIDYLLKSGVVKKVFDNERKIGRLR